MNRRPSIFARRRGPGGARIEGPLGERELALWLEATERDDAIDFVDEQGRPVRVRRRAPRGEV